MEKPKPKKESGYRPRNQMKSVNRSAEFNERKFNLLGVDRRGGALMILWRSSLLLHRCPPAPSYPRGGDEYQPFIIIELTLTLEGINTCHQPSESSRGWWLDFCWLE
jgi:hypothetical protein